MIAAVTLTGGSFVGIVAVLTIITLMIGILRTGNNGFNNRVETVVAPKLSKMQTILETIQTDVAKVDELERRQIQLAAQMENGIKDRLDGLEESHIRNEEKLQGIAVDVAHLTAMMEVHLNWNGPDRRSEE